VTVFHRFRKCYTQPGCCQWACAPYTTISVLLVLAASSNEYLLPRAQVDGETAALTANFRPLVHVDPFEQQGSPGRLSSERLRRSLRLRASERLGEAG